MFLTAGVLSILFGLLCILKPKILAYLVGFYLIISGIIMMTGSIDIVLP